MATLEVRINYKTSLTRACFWGLTLLSPVWGLFPLALLFFNYYVYHSSNTFITALALNRFGAGIFPLFIAGLYAWLYFRNNQLVLSQQGLYFQSSLFCLPFKRNHPWQKLESAEVTMSGHGNTYRNCILLLSFATKVISLDLHYLSAHDVEQLLLALETFGGPAGRLEAVQELKALVKSELDIKGITSYTNLWEKELRYRYAATTFIPFSPGSTLQDGRIKILKQLGFGGLSAIYLVQCHGQQLAILKESVLPDDVDNHLRAKAEEQFEREARILAGLKHPRLARVLDHFVERRHYILLEYIHGKDLRQYTNDRGALAPKTVLIIALQIADILDYLHTRNPAIIHRDLTPENLIINEKGKIMLIDFGAANEFLHTATGTLVGKHAYMAPEQLKGKAHTQSDLYALGGTMHFLLTAGDPTPLSPSHPRQINAYIVPEIDALVFRLTQFDMESRYQTAAEVASQLKQLLQEGKY